MRAALALARRGLGNVWPNPAVGCVIVQDGRVVGRGWTQPGGRPHAETEALAMAGEAARGAVAYVTLEPCSHHGKTPPCAAALARAGIARVVAAMEDPDERVSGQGFALLREAGIEVSVGIGAEEAAELNAGFFLKVAEGRPLVTLKLATTLDGRIATHGGESKWITGEAARAAAHLLRAEHDAVMIGSGTALADDPELTCRLPGLGDRSPVRLVVDGRLRLPLTGKLVSGANDVPTWVLTLEGCDTARREVLEEAGVDVVELPAGTDGSVDLVAALAMLGKSGLTRVLVEGGAHLAAALLRAGLVDRMVWFRAPRMMGGDGLPAAVAFGIDHLGRTPRFELVEARPVGHDLMEIYKKL
ncbi:bifunctional diaminohydroxyphosphoribosylaminopyrimidine deaminase/5-amino-6-(5-phosphoribosylamino)uracil reductase RibD [Magnetospirillum sp. UT-4]|uniref:bifunctional diaminohydroxyphosphoribosylaminopyrimidine deaminase/5-amino-6-(5-phosphoribosylamino)uracil reductase RibD n=1 Tax=Magnetospirillum sp. UT-4 TaxID=2681467 RepID=UPI00137E6CC3|nr:bifunctional diaminohydroxyphosphoribosylaminopyrimidine deaminase/5-amino-6-(5-phosphoribosylamino)uracil reductase RibD [Magnetospirillum sp. UT-4]CAA7617803.1 fused diaminohydroxyphosphoribosylaminopyrimidine deaminase;5-amino-6-(5-phosphoribosylamino) uracil reductase [Magnetospirillum sp. UT-4]